MKRMLIIVALFTIVVLAACASEPVEVTRVVSEVSESEVEVTRIVETKVEVEVEVEIEVTRLVEIPVEVTRIVEEVVIVTPTSLPPTSTPETPDYGSRDNPYPLGVAAQMSTRDGVLFDLAFLEVLRGDRAWQQVHADYSRNEPAPEGAEWILYKAGVTNMGSGSELLEFEGYDIDIVSQNRIFSISDAYDYSISHDPKLEFDLLPGGHSEGWYAMSIPIDPEATFLFNDVYFALSGDVVIPDADRTSEDISGLEGSQFDPDFFTDKWSLEGFEDGDSFVYEFRDDGSYVYEFTMNATVNNVRQEFTGTDSGSWEYRDGNTVCLTDQEGEFACSQWVIEGDSLTRTPVEGDEGATQVFSRQ